MVRDGVPNSIFYTDGLDGKCTVAHGSLEDTLFCSRVMAEYDIQTVFHLGAQTQVTTANWYPYSTFEANIKGTYSILDAARRLGGDTQVIVASSDKAYGSCT